MYLNLKNEFFCGAYFISCFLATTTPPHLAKVRIFGNYRKRVFFLEEKKRMIQLLFLVLFVEGFVAFFLLVKIGPLRDLVMKSLDQLKMGKGPATVKTIAGTMSVILLSSLMSIVKIQNKGAKLGTMSPMDQVLWRTHLLEASLMGAFMLLSSWSFASFLFLTANRFYGFY